MFCLDLWSVCVIFGSWEQKITHPRFPFKFLSPLRSFLPHVVSFFLAPSLPLIYRRYSGMWPPGCCWWCREVQGALLSSCQGLCGPWGGGHQPKAPGQFYCPAAFQSKKASVRRVFGRGWGGYGRGSGLSVTAAPLLPCPVVSCLSWRRGADKCTCLKSTPPGQMPISPPPSPRFYRNAACAMHRCPFTLF